MVEMVWVRGRKNGGGFRGENAGGFGAKSGGNDCGFGSKNGVEDGRFGWWFRDEVVVEEQKLMVDFGEEFIIESYKIPWLIWIQLLIMILLILILIFGFTDFTPDPAVSSAAAAVAPPSNGLDATAPPTHLNNPTSSNGITKVDVEDRRVHMDAGTTGESIREEDRSGEESSLKDRMLLKISGHPNHPCSYIGLAKRALLKCLGLDYGSESSSNTQHEKRK
ncbi:hypothetical protein BUALT_Bualt04G0014800 [Buddleja alternifolia]|uniref:Uncharacterized protein n=1 Tax=Buddleja alternifolia TaxID=168488 RepID=A0AAV6XWD5_9LAMI|nr:hypothetical protein BUALT_Bualt04G0014800 [Buddleja alternifolia]